MKEQKKEPEHETYIYYHNKVCHDEERTRLRAEVMDAVGKWQYHYKGHWDRTTAKEVHSKIKSALEKVFE